jgi:two-component system, NarL family, response regulator DevR
MTGPVTVDQPGAGTSGHRHARRPRPKFGEPDSAGPLALIRVFLLEDHEFLRAVLTQRLNDEPDMAVVGAGGSAAAAVRQIATLRPDVAVLDVHLPDGDGITVCGQARRLDRPPAVLMLTCSDDAQLVGAARAAGAAGYLVKKLRGLDLSESVRLVAAGGQVYDDLPQPQASLSGAAQQP